MADGLEKQVEDSVPNPVLVALKKKIATLQVVYFVLFAISIVLIVYNRGASYSSSNTVLWAISLGGAVIVRLIRTSMVNKYNSLLMGGRAGPLS